MPPRIPFLPWLRPVSATNAPCASAPLRFFPNSPVSSAANASKKRRGQDPYAQAQARARKAANISRQETLQNERTAALGDPVRGVTTPFIQSFDTAGAVQSNTEGTKLLFNHFIELNDIERSLERSFGVTKAQEPDDKSGALDSEDRLGAGIESYIVDGKGRGRENATVEEAHTRAATAISRIVSLNNASGADRRRVNIQRCIETFGRHNTDQTLPPKPRSIAALSPSDGVIKQKVRAGPDTGSSEVQIAILTAKIRAVANALEESGRGDKHNKRNLRVLVHKRQKLLQYLRRKERGGPRWQKLIETLGLTEGTWKGEISL